ncbi:DNA topoisomerase IB [Pseudonocardia eucalypti]|uniref:DNA topoisomerase IB n=1 Tax=Pseudonocardia eucalypti TaxID=648755 RepID=UPI0017A653C4|nr:DNA topoisomerase IB [Pseudonocardia eucalypti]
MAETDLGGGLVRVDPSDPGIGRSRRGRGFRYFDADGRPLADRRELARVRALAVPPAWREVWICAEPDGHIQAVGTDAAGRKQYLYHGRWRRERDREKFDRVLRLARRLPPMRDQVAARLAEGGLGRERVLAGALRMLELGAFRVGGEEYAPADEDDDGTFGLATLRRDHVRRVRGEVRVCYPAKGGAERIISLRDPEIHRLVGALLRRRGSTDDLLVYRNGRDWHDVRADDINGYLKELVGPEYTAKDLRTWNATVLAAVVLANCRRERAGSARGRRREFNRACKRVAEHLGNTATVARQSYIDPRVAEAFEHGRTIERAVRRAARKGVAAAEARDIVEPAVARLLKQPRPPR